MEDRKLEFRWIGYCEANNKVWGWFVDTNSPLSKNRYGSNEIYCFWSVVGKTISLNKERRSSWDIEAVQKKKVDNKYVQITEDQLVEMWPDFRESLANRMIFATLAGTI